MINHPLSNLLSQTKLIEDLAEQYGTPAYVYSKKRLEENIDKIFEDYDMRMMKEVDLCAIMDSGAYGYSMSHNFNTNPSPSEILIDQNNPILIRKRESIIDLFRGCDV